MVDNGEHNDYIFNYHSARLAFGLFLSEVNDAIKEGDGDRLEDSYKLALLFFYQYGHTKYAYAVLLYLVQLNAFLPWYEALDLKWNRFHNTHGGKGRNIPLDLRKEQQNKILKTMWRTLGPNINEKSAARTSASLESLEMLLESVDKDGKLNKRVGYRSSKAAEEAVKQIVNDLTNKKVFQFCEGREGYPSFPSFGASLLADLDYRELHQWMTGKIKLWGSIYNS